jgi:NADPH:quinone reductase-like Zn-dependent oxidoreductase
MKAVILNGHGAPDVLKYTEDFKTPAYSADEVLVKIESTSVNRVDLVIRNGYPGLSLNFPHIPGGDITGVIAEKGSNVTGFSTGDRVVCWPIVITEDDDFVKRGRPSLSPKWKYFGMHMNGSYAEYVCVHKGSLVKLPDNVSFDDAAALPVAGLTAYHAVNTVGNLKKGETFFIWGGTSGLGIIAVQLALSEGAEVIATAGNEEKAELLKKLGVKNIFNHYNDRDIAGEVLKLTDGYGADVVIDYIGPATHEQSFKMVRKGGKILWCGIMTGRETNVSIHMTYLRHVSLMGLYLGEINELESLVKSVSEGKVKPQISEILPLKDASKAHLLMQEGKTAGKIILKP